MSTKNDKIESMLKKPGDVGGQLVGYAEKTRAEREALDAAPEETSDEALATAEFETASGKSIGEMTESDFQRIPVKLMARNRAAMTELNVIFKDPSMTGHWFHRHHKQGQRVTQAYMQGFTACTKDDVEFAHSKTTDDNGSLVMGDLVLMKISKAALWGGMYKDNVDKAKGRVNKVMTDPRAANYQTKNPYLATDGSTVGDGRNPTYVSNLTRADHVDADAARKLVYQD